MGFLDGIMKGVADATLGPDPRVAANSYRNLMTEINSRYDTQKQAFEADPKNKGQQFQLPDPLTRWRDQVDAMIGSGDPILQKEGLNMLSQYQQTATAPTSNSAPTSYKEYQLLQSEGYKGSFQDYLADKQSRGGTSIKLDLNTGAGTNYLPEKMLGKFVNPDGTPTMTYEEFRAGAKPIQSETQRTAGTGGDVLQTATEGMEQTMPGATSNAPIENIMTELRSKPGLIGELTDLGLNLAGKPMSTAAAEFVNYRASAAQQTVKLMSGASATDSEKEDYRRMLPKLTDPLNVQIAKMKQAEAFADQVIERNIQAGIAPPSARRGYKKGERDKVSQGTDTVLKQKTQPKQTESNVVDWNSLPE